MEIYEYVLKWNIITMMNRRYNSNLGVIDITNVKYNYTIIKCSICTTSGKERVLEFNRADVLYFISNEYRTITNNLIKYYFAKYKS